MGFLHLRLLPVPIAALVAALVPVHAIAQQGGGSVQDFRLDPALDPNRPKPPEREGPEVDNRPAPVLPATPPAEITPPAAQPQLVPPPVIRPAPVPAPDRAERTPEVSQPTPRAEPAPVAPVAPAPLSPPATAPAPAAQLPQAPVADLQPSTTEARAPTPSGGLPWLWIAVGLAIAAGLGAFLMLRRRGAPAEEPAIEEPAEPVAATAPAEGFAVPAPPMPVPAVPAPAATARLSLEFEALEARTSIVAATIGYRLTIRNEGAIDAQDVVVAAVMANAEAQQEQTLARFFAAPTDAPTHQIGRVGAGDWVEMKGELRLDHNAIAPIRVQDKMLFIPVLAFTAHYGWDGGHRGYSAAAFIVGQESDPPQERMAPFRLDLGPRQFKSIGSRLGQSALVS
jgi:hypothetical protein